jgi:hypothetical protein
MQFSVTKAMATGGWRVGWRLGLFTGGFTLVLFRFIFLK